MYFSGGWTTGRGAFKPAATFLSLIFSFLRRTRQDMRATVHPKMRKKPQILPAMIGVLARCLGKK